MGAADSLRRPPSAASLFLREAGKDPGTGLAPLTDSLHLQTVSEGGPCELRSYGSSQRAAGGCRMSPEVYHTCLDVYT